MFYRNDTCTSRNLRSTSKYQNCNVGYRDSGLNLGSHNYMWV